MKQSQVLLKFSKYFRIPSVTQTDRQRKCGRLRQKVCIQISNIIFVTRAQKFNFDACIMLMRSKVAFFHPE